MSRSQVIDPTRIAFQEADGTTNPQTPYGEPGTWTNGRRGDSVTGCLPAVKQVSQAVLAGTDPATGAFVMTVSPIADDSGSAWAEGMAPASITFTAAATTLANTVIGLIANAQTAATIVLPADLAAWRRFLSYVDVSIGSTAQTIVATSKTTGLSFTFSLTVPAGNTATVTDTTSAETRLALWGCYMAIDRAQGGNGYNASGQPYLKPITNATTAADVIGPVCTGSDSLPLASGAQFRTYGNGSGTLVIYGDINASGADAIPRTSIGLPVYIRHTASGTALQPGMVTDATGAASGATANVWTGTPTAVSDTVYTQQVVFGTEVVLLTFLADGSATATEIVTGLKAQLALHTGVGGRLYGLVGSGTTTFVITGPSDGRGFTPSSVGVGVLAWVETTAEVSTHLYFPRDRFAASSPARGSVPVTVPNN